MVACAFAAAPGVVSPMMTRSPAIAATCAIPVPMAPAPMTPTTVFSSSAISAALEGRFAFLEECGHTFAIVVSTSCLALKLLLEIELRVEIDSQRSIEAALDESEPAGRLGGE